MKKLLIGLLSLALSSVLVAQPTPAGGAPPATQTEVNVGTVANKYVSPLTLKNFVPGTPGPGTFSSVTDSGLTSGRVTFATTGGLLADDADLTFATNTLTFTNGVTTQLAMGATTPGLIAGSSGAITLTGAGTNQSITLTPSGTAPLILTSLLKVIPVALTRPTEPVVTAGGTNNAGTNYRYVLVVHGAGTTAASATMVNPFAGNSTLDGTHFNIIATVSQPGATSIDVIRTAPNTLTTGYIGSVAPGSSLNDTGLTASQPVGATPYIPAADFGSAGVYSNSGPVVIVPTGSTTGDFGGLQVAEEPMVIKPGDTYGYDGPMASFISSTPSGTNRNNAVVFQAANSNNPGLVFRYSNGSALKPVAQGAAQGWISAEAYITDIAAWKMATYSEFGSSGTTATTSTSNYGRYQWAVAHGEASGFTRLGLTLASRSTYTGTLNPVALLTTDFADIRQYRVGYAETSNTDNITNYERADLSWASAGTVWNCGPVAGGTGTLRSVAFTGASHSFPANVTLGGAYIGSTSTLSGAGACDVTTETTLVTTTGALNALTLANGTNGQHKYIKHVVDGGSFVLTPTTKTGWSTYTSTVAGETIHLHYTTTTGWFVVGSYLGTIAP